MKKVLFASAFILLAIFLTPRVALAQGTCTCYDGALPGECMQGPSPCDTGYSPSTCYYGPSGCTCDCVPSVGYCCNSNSDCSGGKVCLNVPGGCTTQGYFGECITPPPTTPVPPAGAVEQWCDPSTKKLLNSAIGCIPIKADENTLMGWILQWAIGIGGGVAFLLIIYAGFMIMTSQGSPDRLQAGKELLTSALAGIILLIFSIFLLKLIGVEILKLPPPFGV